MKRIRITTPWFEAIVNVGDHGDIKSIESCSAEPLTVWRLENLKFELERAAVWTGWGVRGVTFTDLPDEKAAA